MDESDRDANRGFLGQGWTFPVGTDGTGQVRLSRGETDIEESIRLVLGTAKGERVMRPDFGCGIHDYAFATVETTSLDLMETSVREALVEWEPRIDVRRVEASADRVREGIVTISVDYRVRSTNTERNLVYPFYLRE